jgi:hypothetical protein
VEQGDHLDNYDLWNGEVAIFLCLAGEVSRVKEVAEVRRKFV